jgi:cytoskeleton protein RodZ
MAVEDDTPAPPTPRDAGAMLAAAREAAGLSIDAVAGQLKLAPRQVRAIEAGDFAALPGRTFVRGFARNYARLLGLDAASVLAALPDAEAEPGLSHPHLASTDRAMGEIPAERARPRSVAGWAIALALLAIVVVAVAYERLRPPPASEPPASAPAAEAPAPPSAPPPGAPPGEGKPLPNPAAPAPTSSNDGNPATSDAAVVPAAADAAHAGNTAATLANPPSGALVPVSASAAPTQRADAATGAAAQPSAGTQPAVGGPTLAIVFRGTSWIDVKDAGGASLLTMTGSAGTSRTLDAAPPLALVVGNASDVDVTYRGAPVDLTPHIRQNVARLTLR